MSNDKAEASRLGARHLLANASIDKSFAGQSAETSRAIRIIASHDFVRTVAGQHLLSFLVNVLCRQFGLIEKIELCIPDLELLPRVLHFSECKRLPDAMLTTAMRIAGKAIDISLSPTPKSQVDVEVTVGLERPTGFAKISINTVADGWRAFVGTASEPTGFAAQSSNPVGPYFAACVTAGEVFKYLMQLREVSGTFIESFAACLWSSVNSDDWNSLPPIGPEPTGDMGAFYVVGAGAVGQAALATLSAVDHITGNASVIDDDAIDKDGTNLNRCVLAIQTDREVPKVEVVKRRLSSTALSIFPVQEKWEEYVYDAELRKKQPPALGVLEASYKYELVLSCVDVDNSRRAIQQFWPKFILGGSTLDLGLTVAAYDMRTEYECLSCNAAVQSETLTIQAMANRLRHAAPDVAKAEAERQGIDWMLIASYLASPQCGSLGEKELRKFISKSQEHVWSVGFVSAAAGVLLAANAMRHALFGETIIVADQGNALRLSFLRPGFRWSKHRRLASCECNSIGRQEFEKLWGNGNPTTLLVV